MSLDGAELWRLPALTALDLSASMRLKTTAAVGACLQLQTLNLAECMLLDDIDGLAACAALTRLDLSGCVALKNFAPLSGERMSALAH